jgi:putative transcriptional regulator
MNGFTKSLYDGEEYISIKDIDGLHRAIGMQIVMDKKAPTGREIRFLRDEMHVSQSELGARLSVSDQSVARWEKGHTDIPGTAILAIKVLYLFSLMPEKNRGDVISKFLSALGRLSEDDETVDRLVLAYDGDKWSDAA